MKSLLPHAECRDGQVDRVMMSTIVTRIISQTCKEVRARFQMEHIPVIMLSAKSTAQDVAQGLESGANDYVKKPFERLELISRITAQIRIRCCWDVCVSNCQSLRFISPGVDDHSTAISSRFRLCDCISVNVRSDIMLLFLRDAMQKGDFHQL